MPDREMLVTLVRGMEDRLLEDVQKSIQHIIRQGHQEQLPQSTVSDQETILVGDMPTKFKGQTTIWGMFISVYKPQRLIGKSPETERLYGISVRNFGRWLARPALLSDLTDERVGAFAQWRSAEAASLHTCKKDVTQLLALWRYAAQLQLGPKAPSIREPDAPEQVPDAWTHSELSRLISHIRQLSGYFRNGASQSIFWESLVSACLDTGERIGALLLARWEAIDVDGWLVIAAETRKGGRKGKRFKLSAHTLALLKKHREYVDSELIFEWPYSPNYLYPRFGRILESAGLPNKRRTKFHKLRRTTATHFEAAGGDATELLGHSARSVTRRYIDERFVKRPQPADISPNFFTKQANAPGGK